MLIIFLLMFFFWICFSPFLAACLQHISNQFTNTSLLKAFTTPPNFFWICAVVLAFATTIFPKHAIKLTLFRLHLETDLQSFPHYLKLLSNHKRLNVDQAQLVISIANSTELIHWVEKIKIIFKRKTWSKSLSACKQSISCRRSSPILKMTDIGLANLSGVRNVTQMGHADESITLHFSISNLQTWTFGRKGNLIGPIHFDWKIKIINIIFPSTIPTTLEQCVNCR